MLDFPACRQSVCPATLGRKHPKTAGPALPAPGPLRGLYRVAIATSRKHDYRFFFVVEDCQVLPLKPVVPALSKEDLLRLALIVGQYDHNPHYRELADKIHALLEDHPE